MKKMEVRRILNNMLSSKEMEINFSVGVTEEISECLVRNKAIVKFAIGMLDEEKLADIGENEEISYNNEWDLKTAIMGTDVDTWQDYCISCVGVALPMTSDMVEMLGTDEQKDVYFNHNNENGENSAYWLRTQKRVLKRAYQLLAMLTCENVCYGVFYH